MAGIRGARKGSREAGVGAHRLDADAHDRALGGAQRQRRRPPCVAGQYLYASRYRDPDFDVVAAAHHVDCSLLDALVESTVSGVGQLCGDMLGIRFYRAGCRWVWNQGERQEARSVVRVVRCDAEGAFVAEARAEARSIRIGEGRLVRAVIGCIGRRFAVAVLAHHLIADAAALKLLLDDIQKRLKGNSANHRAPSFLTYHGLLRSACEASDRDEILAEYLTSFCERDGWESSTRAAVQYRDFGHEQVRLADVVRNLERGLARDFDSFLGDGLCGIAACAATAQSTGQAIW